MTEDERRLLEAASARADAYIANAPEQRAFPSRETIAALSAFDEPLPDAGADPFETLEKLDVYGSPATTATNAGRYFGFVIGASLPVATAAERLTGAWDQSGSSHVNSPAVAAIEAQAARWLLDILDLPGEAAVGFGTGATANGLACLATARRTLLARAGWDFDADGLAGSPQIRAVVSERAHITVKKALRLLGFGMKNLIVAPVDAHGRIDPARLPALDARTILILQAGEVNTGEFDPFPELIAVARAAGAWVHVDGAFGLWARACAEKAALADGVDGADSWTTDAHKWLNAPYDCAVSIVRDRAALYEAMNSEAPYVPPDESAQRNLTLEFSRRARGVATWAALRTLGRAGVEDLVARCCRHARLAAGMLRAADGVEVLNRVVLNQVLVRCKTDDQTRAALARVQEGGRVWFGGATWDGRPAMRISFSSWRTTDDDARLAAKALIEAL